MKKSVFFLFFLLNLVLSACNTQVRKSNNNFLQVPSPDWSKQIIYFILTDRFNDGNPDNNDFGAGEYNPTLNSHYSGGDLEGIRQKLDYIQGLGITAVWITPPVLNQWINPNIHYTGYHGYWASDFSKIDPHVGTLENYRQLVREIHHRGMYLIQDIVCNHTGDFFSYTRYDPKHPDENTALNTNSVPPLHPQQFPFSQNNPANPKDLTANIYHWTPDITSYKDKNQLLHYQMSGLDDLNTKNPAVRAVLKDSLGGWIRKAGVDGFRIDTALYVEHNFWNDFLHSDSPKHPGIKIQATALGKTNFYTFGEVWVNIKPNDNEEDLIAASFQGSTQKPEMDVPLAFPLQVSIQRVFGEGKPPLWLSYRIRHLLSDYRHPEILPTFIDNHDMNRFLKSSDISSLKQALLTLFTLPGVPVVYYGTEQEMTLTRGSMFAQGYGSGGLNHFDTSSDLYTFISNLSYLRRENSLFRSTNIRLLAANPVRSGVLAYLKTEGSNHSLVLINTSDHATLPDVLPLPWKAGTVLKPLFSLSKHPKNRMLDTHSRLSGVLPPKSAEILVPISQIMPTPPGKTLTLDQNPENRRYKKHFTVSGYLNGGKLLRRVIDGDMENTVQLHTDASGNWQDEIPVESLPNGYHFVSFYTHDTNRRFLIQTASFPFVVDVPYVLSAVWKDPIGDDRGPNGSYIYPTDPSFSHQADLSEVRLASAGQNLKLRLTIT